MKNLIFLILILNLFSCKNSCQKQGREETLRVGTNATFMPFESINEQGKLEGLDIDLAYALGKVLNKKVIISEFEFDALIAALDDRIDIALSALSITESRKQKIAMVPYTGHPITQISFLFWQHKPEGLASFPDLKDITDKKGLSISVQAGHFLEDFLKRQKINIKPLPGPPEQILDLKYGKSMAAAVDPENAKTLMNFHSELKELSLPLPKEDWDLGYGVGIKKSRTDLILEIEKAISKLKEDGTIADLEKKWLKGKE